MKLIFFLLINLYFLNKAQTCVIRESIVTADLRSHLGFLSGRRS